MKKEPQTIDFSKWPTYEESLNRMKDFEKMNKPLSEAQLKQAEDHNKNYKWKQSEWQKLDWELIKNRINFKLKAQHILERLQHGK